jgi:acyl-CoA synthetase (AMP-forming)/AMP-acid ligase II
MAGAPVSPALFAELQGILPQGTAHSPYGATEALPLCSISADEVLGPRDQASEPKDHPPNTGALSSALGTWPLELGTADATAAGHGTCVGRPVAEISVKIIAITDTPLATLADARELPAGEIGEIIVCGPVVTKQYDQLPEATALAKISGTKVQGPRIQDPDSPLSPPALGPSLLALDPSAASAAVWHRMGDLGYLDAAGRLWFCGRKAERVETAAGTLYTELVEPVFNAHPAVRRTALIGLGKSGHRYPALVVEADPAAITTPSDRRRLVRELRQLGEQQLHTVPIRRFYLHPGFPVDVRHNAKIHRLALARWAVGQPGYEMDRRAISREVLGL